MKIKTSFTTNSSSSSFVCWGTSKDNVSLGTEDSDYLKAFENKLKEYKDDLSKLENKNTYVGKYYPGYIKEMESLETEEEKIEYAQSQRYIDENEYPEPLSCGGPEQDFVGIRPTDIANKFPDVKFGEVKTFVADKINETLGTKLTEKDISYYEEGWMDN